MEAWQRYKRMKYPRNTRSMPFRRVHQHLPIWARRLLNRWMRRYGDPGDRR